MSTLAEVRLWGTTIGAVVLNEGSPFALFEYDPSFIPSGIQVAPLMMPLSRQVYSFPALPLRTFHGLPGLLADSLPDAFGNAVIDAWLARQGRTPNQFNAVERLCYTGTRGMGALEFYPLIERGIHASTPLEVDELVRLAGEILRSREDLKVSMVGDAGHGSDADAMKQILQVGTSAGGARAKAVIALNPLTGEVRSGQAAAGPGFQHWLMKFDGVNGNRDRELSDPAGNGLVEYAYWMMARAAGIEMSEARLYAEHGRNHFLTRRFDRTESGDKLHMQSLGALAHLDYNSPGACQYEQVYAIMRLMGLPAASADQFFRRMAFNIVARNQDDHVKNIAFLMDRRGIWRLAPAYDVTYSFQVGGQWTGRHQMSMNGRLDGFALDDFAECGRTANMVRGRAREIVDEICSTAAKWPEYAAAAGVPEERAAQIAGTFRKF